PLPDRLPRSARRVPRTRPVASRRPRADRQRDAGDSPRADRRGGGSEPMSGSTGGRHLGAAWGTALLVAAAAMLLAAGCERESKVLRYRPVFAGLDGATTATPAVGAELMQLPGPGEGGEDDDRIVFVYPDGSVRLVS